MALTSAQESVLEQIIEAFQNGKRLSDLPDVKGTNPYNLLVEVLDEDGESKKAALASLLPYAEEQSSYGIEFDTSVSSPSCLRIGNGALHKVLPVQSRMKGCLLDDSGKVVEYLNPKDWTGNTRDGSRGQVMVEIPLHYRKFETDGTKRRVRLSELPLPGYHQVPKMYVSAYEASVQRSTSMLASVVNDSIDYRGGDNTASYDGTYRSLLGRPATYISRTDFRAYARKRKPETAEWNCMTYEMQKTLYWLFVVEYATLNSQADYNAALTTEGLRQGGLGAGVTTFGGDWDTFNGYKPFVPCGHTDSLGNGTGTVQYTVLKEDKSEWKTFDVPRYRGVENPFGHISKWTDGINIHMSTNTDKGGDGLSKVFVCNDPSLFNDINYTGYSHVGNEAREEGFSKELIFGEYGEIITAVVGGSSTTYHCDNHYTYMPYSEMLSGVLFGGTALYGAEAGLAYSASGSAPSNMCSLFGSRLCFLPK
jgi:hypothetical protein